MTHKNLLRILLVLIASFSQSNLIAQVKNIIVKDTLQQDIIENNLEKSYFKLSGSYLSNYVYNGRQDSMRTPYFIPAIGYFNKNGFDVIVSGYYLNVAKEYRFDFLTFDMNYNHEFTENFSTGLVASKTFYNSANETLSSDINANIGANGAYDFGFIELVTSVDLLFSQKKDIALNIELEHEFNIGNGKHEFKITPTFDVNFSTLNYYEGYLNNKIGKRNTRSNNNTNPSITAVTTVNEHRFTLLAYEFSAPISYQTNKFTFFMTPTFAIPKNTIYTKTVTTAKFNNGPQTVISRNSTTDSENNLKQNFFIEFGVSYKILL